MTQSGIKQKIHYILHLDEPPNQLALSFAVGVYVAFMPTLGFHTITILLLAWVLRLNKAVALIGTFINNPWTIAAVYIGPTWAAAVVLRKLGIDVPSFHYEALAERFVHVMDAHHFWQPAFWTGLGREFRPYLFAIFVGTTTAGIFAACIAYVGTFFGIRYYRLEREKIKDRRSHPTGDR